MNNIKIIAIDPGTHFTGLCYLTVNNNIISIEHVETIEALLLDDNTLSNYLHGSTWTRIINLSNYISSFAQKINPDYFCSEKNYISLNVHSGLTIGELITAVRTQVYLFNPYIRFEIFEASSVKKNIGVKGTSGDKEDVKNAILNLNLQNNSNIDLNLLDEHSIDAIAVGLFKCFNLIY